MLIKTFSELSRFNTFEERYQYLRVGGIVGQETFGSDRYINQLLYTSNPWRAIRDKIIIRDQGCDLGIEDREINDRIIIHHINILTLEDIELNSEYVLNPEFLICTSKNTHLAIHYGDESLLQKLPIARSRNDTCPWR